MNSAFRPHGNFTTRVEGRLVVSEVTGPWNKELVDFWGDRCYPDAKKLSASGPWIGIAVIRESMLCPPDAIARLGAIASHSATHLHCLGYAMVADAAVEGRDFLAPTFARAFEPHLAHAMFATLDQARTWAQQLLRADAER